MEEIRRAGAWSTLRCSRRIVAASSMSDWAASCPWEQYVGRLETGQTVDATVTRATPSRAFARVADGVDGLIYVTELASERVGDPNDAVHACDVLPVRIVAIDRERRRLSLSARLAERT